MIALNGRRGCGFISPSVQPIIIPVIGETRGGNSNNLIIFRGLLRIPLQYNKFIIRVIQLQKRHFMLKWKHQLQRPENYRKNLCFDHDCASGKLSEYEQDPHTRSEIPVVSEHVLG